MRSVPAQCMEPTSRTTSPRPCAISSTRRRMKARIRISLSVGVRLHERQQMVAIELDRFPALQYADVDERRAAGQEGRLAGECAGAVLDDGDLTAVRRPDDAQPPAHHDEERRARFADADQHLARSGRTQPAVPRDLSDLRLGQDREHRGLASGRQ